MQSSSNIDEITELLAESTVTAKPVNTRQYLYKASPLIRQSKEENQEERRRKALEEQQRRRRDFTDLARNLALFKPIFEEFSDEEVENDDEVDEKKSKEAQDLMDHEIFLPENETREIKRKTRGGKRKTKGGNPYRNQLMYAECMQGVPNDLEANWYVVMCPVGKRCLVTSAKGMTISRFRSGRIMHLFESNLPGGSSLYNGNKTSDYCILDCVFDENTATYYVLDLMCWKGHTVYDCDTEFRFYWLRTKLSELEPPSGKTSLYKFKPLDIHCCGGEELSSLITNPQQFGYEPDGLLFFDKRTQYVIGDTPLCGWVGFDKIPEVFGNIEIRV
ncbi:hypothetical protein G9A89_007425 [Geosiphon pyriformis]|nr:hypothetical protein G9A89_007425 [Geosiphon pyriformis]